MLVRLLLSTVKHNFKLLKQKTMIMHSFNIFLEFCLVLSHELFDILEAIFIHC
jgi:hypothetical protein